MLMGLPAGVALPPTMAAKMMPMTEAFAKLLLPRTQSFFLHTARTMGRKAAQLGTLEMIAETRPVPMIKSNTMALGLPLDKAVIFRARRWFIPQRSMA